MDFVNRINQQIHKKKLKTQEYGKLIHFFMKEMNQPYSEIMKIPVPLAFEIMKVEQENQKNIEKEMKKKRGR